MKFLYPHLKLFVLTVCSYLIGAVLYGSYHSDNIFAKIFYGILGLIWLLCFYRNLKAEQYKATSNKTFTRYWMSIFSVLTLIPTILIYLNYQQKLNKPTLIKAERHGVYADFKADGTYIIKSGAWASRKHLYGKYILKDSIIQIDTSNIDNVLTSDRFLIKHANLEKEKYRPDYDRIETETYLVQIDKKGNEILARELFEENLPFKFEVVIDTRK